MKRFDHQKALCIVALIFAIAMAIAIFVKCEKVFTVKDYDIYTISEGQHYANERHPAYINSPFLTIQFTPDETWYYEDDTHWNKLGGLTSANIHQNSIRIAWRCTAGEIRIAIYEYREGERVITPLGTVDRWDSVIIELDENRVMFREKYYYIGDHDQKGWIAFPYFGGEATAPHDMTFRIKYIYYGGHN